MIKLYQFPISHYCEKVRWALDHKEIKHEVVNLLPGLHIKQTTKLAKHSSVPVIVDGDQVIQNSDKIITYLDKNHPQNNLTPTDGETKKQALEWEHYVDTQLGVHVRCVCYHILLDHPKIVIPFFTHNGSWYGKMLLRFGFKKLQSKMRYFMKINEETAQESYKKMEQAIDKIYQHLQSNSYLAGEEFSRADLAAAALLAPLCQPAGYGLNWPKTTPKRLQDIADEFKDKLAWVHDIYKKHR
ncbi:MAG: glutathione S-transferase [Alcanivoracaceae bacterium]|nr:glutathione S-transferase [Alcanivoracaceae bacterium]